MTPTDATVAFYFYRGIQTALVPPEQASSWADSAISEAEDPSYSLIEVSLSRTVPALISALESFPGDCDQEIVGRWLFGKLLDVDVRATEDLAAAIKKAMLVSQLCCLDDELYYELDGLDDGLFLARHEQYGSVAACRSDFLEFLQQNARAFPATSKA